MQLYVYCRPFRYSGKVDVWSSSHSVFITFLFSVPFLKVRVRLQILMLHHLFPFSNPPTSCYNVCREKAAEELRCRDNRQAEPSIWTVSISLVFPACPAGGTLCPTVLLPGWSADGTAAYQVRHIVVLTEVSGVQCMKTIYCKLFIEYRVHTVYQIHNILFLQNFGQLHLIFKHVSK